MGFLSRFTGARKRVDPYGLYEDDSAQLQRFVDAGADVSAPRDSEFSVTFKDEDKARAAAKELGERRFPGELVEPSHGVDEWSIIIYGRDEPLVPDFLRETVDVAEGIATTHGGEYEGWAALYTAEEKAGWGIEPL
ncbi:ribonuclease E inhibitor RraB [Demequina muriae]|uniref:Ribonuclease E inhibitor RraB n=1 Tax=Demequina muriae TaxID=3051664 RepID=A0ABT8GE92_9MICO|nr:ribonuclease E inhibitor RraB [Demequina sp. EGI L300058]MDN4479745.1 ribonuclease E inhibitor RraB [Demequina sp. EGI L300058]